jgi:hypothetical protein
MSFTVRAVISLLAGIGAGVLGFWAVWRTLIGTAFASVPGPGYDEWLLAGIFLPGIVVPMVVFRQLSPATRRRTAESKVPS